MAESLEEELRSALREVFDPELGVNVVDLGLIYGLSVEEAHALIVMTMTTLGCPAADYIEDAVRARGSQVPGISSINVQVVWSPPWSPDLMNDDARRELGFA